METFAYILLLFLSCSIPSHGELFSAMADLEVLLEQEDSLLDIVDEYIQAEWDRLNELKSVAQNYRPELQHPQEFLTEMANPISAFVKLKGFTGLHSRLTVNRAESFINNITAKRAKGSVRYPSREDMRGAAEALFRLQDTYQLRADDIALGKKEIFGTQTPSGTLNSGDCLYMAQIAHSNKDWYHVIIWAEEALRMYAREDDPVADKVDILDYLAFALYHQGNLLRAYKTVREMIQLDPQHERARQAADWYAGELRKQGISPSASLPPVVNYREYPEDPLTEALCRGERLAKVDDRLLYCYYKRDRPFLKVGPLKTELLHVKPKVFLFHEVMSDREIEEIKKIAHPMLKRATVHHRETNEYKPANYRTSKSAWLDGYQYDVVHQINMRLDHMTDLEQSTAEELQIANYGIGGHYSQHFDMATYDDWESFADHPHRNRIATVLFYMSSTEAGGNTVFLPMRISVQPQKGTAVFWHNVKLNGDPDMGTKHAACPVLSGMKWVANKWIHEGGQEFRYPCHPDRDAYF